MLASLQIKALLADNWMQKVLSLAVQLVLFEGAFCGSRPALATKLGLLVVMKMIAAFLRCTPKQVWTCWISSKKLCGTTACLQQRQPQFEHASQWRKFFNLSLPLFTFHTSHQFWYGSYCSTSVVLLVWSVFFIVSFWFRSFDMFIENFGF